MESEQARILRLDAEMRREDEARARVAMSAPVDLDEPPYETDAEIAIREHVAARIVAAIVPLVTIERKANDVETHDEWLAWRRSVSSLNDSVMQQVRAVTQKEGYITQSWLRDVLNTVLADACFSSSDVETQAIAKAVVNEAWQGLDGWTR